MNSTTQLHKWARFLFSFGLIVLFGGGLFLLDGAWQSYNQYIQRTRWPAAEARVAACSIYASWNYSGSPSTKRAWEESTYVRCKLDYDAGSVARESTIKVGDSISTFDRHRVYPAPKLTVAKMRDWIARHPSGSLLTIHYDPSTPGNISLAGADDELRISSSNARLWFGVFASAGGLAIIAIAKLARK